MRKRNSIVIFVSIALLLLIVIGTTYAFFSATVAGTESSSTLTVGGGTLSLTINGGNTIEVNNIIPGSDTKGTKTITITSNNTTDLAMPYSLNLVVENSFSNNAISYTLISTNTDANGSVIPSKTDQIGIASGGSIINFGKGYFTNGNNKVHTYQLNLYFLETAENQNADQGKTINGYVIIESEEAKLADELLQMSVSYNPNGDAIYSKDKNVTIVASNSLETIDESSLKYLWSPLDNGIEESDITNSFDPTEDITASGLTGTYYLYILVKDLEGNSEIHQSNEYYLDNQPPEITLTGGSSINVPQGSTYSELGFTAADVQDGDLSSSVVITGSVDTNTVNTYVLTYTVSDSAGNEDSVTRTVTVVETWLLSTLILGSGNSNVSTPLTTPGRVVSPPGEARLASTSDNYGTSYYYRGTIINNYIVFANMCWRIVRITGDGAIKIVLYNYNPGSVANPCDTAYDGNTNSFARYSGSTYTSEFNTSANDNKYIGFMYGEGNPSSNYATAHANIYKSTILTNLETWYASKLSSYSALLADTIWCNDKKLDTVYPSAGQTGVGTNRTNYSAGGRIYAGGNHTTSANPSLICLNDSTGGKLSKFTADETTYGNGALDYKIGLLSADENAFAGAKYGTLNTYYYLYKNAINTQWWTLSPMFLDGSAQGYVVYNGYNTNVYLNSSGGVRPAVSLIPTIRITGSGTSGDPYIVVT